MPGYANPQNLNRYSYARNNPLRYTDPTGHWEVETNDPVKEQSDKAKKHAEERLKKKKNKGDGGEGTVYGNEEKYGGDTVIGGCLSNNYECLTWELIDQLSYPYTGIYADPSMYPGSTAEYYDLLAYDAYGMNGWDVHLIADLRISNPMTDHNWLAAGVDIDYIYQRGGAGSTNGVYVNFLEELNIDPMDYDNYEASYLNAMMREYDEQLDAAKANFYSDLLTFHEGDVFATYQWLLITKEALGAPD